MSIATVAGISVGFFFGGAVVGAFLMLIVVSASRYSASQEYSERDDFFEQDRNEY